jgi:hypothetical protein
LDPGEKGGRFKTLKKDAKPLDHPGRAGQARRDCSIQRGVELAALSLSRRLTEHAAVSRMRAKGMTSLPVCPQAGIPPIPFGGRENLGTKDGERMEINHLPQREG